MKLTVHLEGTRQDMLNQLSEAKVMLESSLAAQPPAAAGKPGKPAAAKPAPAAEETKEEESSGAEADDDMGFEEKPAAITMEDVVVAFRDFAGAKAGNRDKAKKVLEKFGITSIKDLKKDQYEKAIKLLK